MNILIFVINKESIMAKDKKTSKDEEAYRKNIVIALASNPAVISQEQSTLQLNAEVTGERVAAYVVAIVDKVNEELEEEW